MYRQQQDGSSAAEHFRLSATPDSSPFTQFSSPVYAIDPQLQTAPSHLHPTSAPTKRHSPRMKLSSLDPAAAMDPPPPASRAGSATPGPTSHPGFIPTDRSLPAKTVTRATITQAYIQFIMYCNPNFDLDVDTTTLSNTFESPPKSDNKDFETFRLFELIRKLDSKEIKTWGQLALDLGVEAPDTSKGQSVQKVQQYTVRLKRWMRAMHIDAFFEYLLGKQHVYFNEIPPPNEPYPPGGRDGVVTEEDLAIRGLDPSFRPKRGRRRNSEVAEQDDSGEPEAKQPRLLESAAPFTAGPMSAIPMTAHPDGFHDPWAVASAVIPQNFTPWSGKPPSALPSAVANLRWQVGQMGTPSTPHPMSAISTSMSAHIDAAFDGEPKSAVTPSTRRRRRHGPAVSSAWHSTSTPGAKPRGRPPASRSTQDGPYNTFPADPANEKNRHQNSLPTPLTAEERPSIEHHSPQMQPPSIPEGRRGRLSLQVPQHSGNPVRLATPPTLLVNGETKESETRSDSDDPTRQLIAIAAAQQQPPLPSKSADARIPQFSFETLKKVVASDLLRADIVGRRRRLTGDEAKRLADAILDRLAVARADSNEACDHLSRLTAASWLGVGHHVNVPLGPATGHGKRIQITRFRTDADGYEEITFDENVEDEVREVFDLFWQVSQGGCMGTFEMKGLSLALPQAAGAQAATAETTHDLIVRKSFEAIRNMEKDGWIQQSVEEIARSAAAASRPARDGVDWRSKYMALEFAASLAKGSVERDRQRTLDRLLDVLL